jgi:lysophospholipase L1-like esterase
MRVLLITDSHGRGLASKMERIDTSLSVLNIRLGQRLSAIRGLYRRKLRSVQDYSPQAVIIHLGHNDLVPHAKHNPSPLFITSVIHQIREFVEEIASNLPDTIIFVSSILPRVVGEHFGIAKVGSYNRLARRFGEMVRSFGNKPGSNFYGIVNRSLWGRIARSEVLPGNHHHSDGLHLNAEGKNLLVRGWIKALYAAF